MLNVHWALRDVDASVLLPLHDELLLHVHADAVDTTAQIVAAHMCVRVSRSMPPLPVQLRVGAHWAALRPLPLPLPLAHEQM